MPDFDLITLGLIGGAAVAGAALSGLIVWFMKRSQANILNQQWQEQLNQVSFRRDQYKDAANKLKGALELDRAKAEKHAEATRAQQIEIRSLHEKFQNMTKDLLAIRAERDQLRQQVANQQKAVNAAREKLAAMQEEVKRGREMLKLHLETAKNERGSMQSKIEASHSEQESLNRLLKAARTEYESVSSALASAQSRMKNLESMEEKIASLESENVNLRHKAEMSAKEAQTLKRQVDDINELKKQNSQLVHCLESVDASRKQYEEDARRYQKQYKRSEQDSDTLRFRIDDMEKNFAELEKAYSAATPEPANDSDGGIPVLNGAPEGDADDLTEIIGVGKMFEETLHELGIYQFAQIAAFGPADIARVNIALKEFGGRIEHDDWVGQAQALHREKYGTLE